MPFAHLKRILKLDRLRLRGRRGARDEFFNGIDRKQTVELTVSVNGGEVPTMGPKERGLAMALVRPGNSESRSPSRAHWADPYKSGRPDGS